MSKVKEFDPEQFKGEEGTKKFREYLKGLTRVQLLEWFDTNDSEILPDGKEYPEWWREYWPEEESRDWPLGKTTVEDHLSKVLKHYATYGKPYGALGNDKLEAKTIEAIVERLDPQVQGIQKKLDRLITLLGEKEIPVSIDRLLNLK